MRLNVRHTTEYDWDEPVSYALQRLRLMPKATSGQTVIEWTTDLDGGTEQVRYEDCHRNSVTLVSSAANTSRLRIVSHGIVDTADNNGILGAHDGPLPLWFFERASDLTAPGDGIRALASSITRDEGDLVGTVHGLMRAVAGAVAYRPGTTDVKTSAEEALSAGAGVCQDQAHVFIACARLLGFPARYVGGYLFTTDPEQDDQAHGWAELHLPVLGWVGFDVANGISPDEKYVRVATGLDFAGAAPVTGVRMGPGDERLSVELQVDQ